MKIVKTIIITLLLLSTFGCSDNSKPKFQKEIINGEEFICYENFKYPSIFGEPQLSKKEIKTLSIEEAQDRINTYADFVMYTKDMSFDNNEDRIQTTYPLLYGDYEEIGIVSTVNYFSLMYIKTNNKYYPIDLKNYDKEWLKNYRMNKYSFDNVEDMCKAIKGSNVYLVESKPLTKQKDFYYASEDEYVELCDGEKALVSYRLGSKVYEYAGTQIPLGLGLPKLKEEDIQKIIDDKNYEIVAETINTFADAVMYCNLSGLEWDRTGRFENNEYTGADVGNIVSKQCRTNMSSSISGLEVLYINKAQCSAMATLMKYLLNGDYPEVGYVSMNEHAMTYIQGEDKKFYLINSAQYARYEEQIDNVWIRDYVDEKACCDTLEELMSELYNSKKHPNGQSEIYNIFTYNYDGVWQRGAVDGEKMNQKGVTQIFPEGSNPINWSNDCKCITEEPTFYSKLDYITGLKDDPHYID